MTDVRGPPPGWLALAVGAALVVAGLASLTMERERVVPIDAKAFKHEQGHAHVVVALGIAPGAGPEGDTNQQPRRSALTLYEDGRPLGPAHSDHGQVRAEGKGRYSHWHGGLLMSALDNSNPATNGRRYSYGWVESWPRWPGWIAVALGTLLLAWRARLIAQGVAIAARVCTQWAARAAPAAGPWAIASAGPALVALGIGALHVGIERSFDIPPALIQRDAGHAYLVYRLPVPGGVTLLGDDTAHPRRSQLMLRENGRQLGDAHSDHAQVRALGGGRYSHWGQGLLFSAHDNGDARSKGRTYSVAYPEYLPAWLAWLAIAFGSALLLARHRRWLGSEAALLAASGRAVAASARAWRPTRTALLAGSLFVVLAAVVLAAGFDRSGWILITQPLERSHATNSLLGFSFIRDGSVLHKENLSAIWQAAWFAGADIEPDIYFRRPVYAFLGALLAPILGIDAALVAVNLAAWAVAVWLCHRLASRLYGDAAGRWAALLAAAGCGFGLHALDLSAHLLAFTFYMGGVVLVHETGLWRRPVGWRIHALVALYLALACLQYNTGIALVASYAVVAFRHNRLWMVAAAAAAALAAQPLWGWTMGGLHELRHGIALGDLAGTEAFYLREALARWGAIFALPFTAMVANVAGLAASFAAFEAPWVVLAGAATLALDARRSPEGRARALFALPFIAFPVLAALVFAPYANARGYLIYGIAILFFAAAGAWLARIARGRPVKRWAAAAFVVATIGWSYAHIANQLGPGKAYFVGMRHAAALFTPPSWEATSLTGSEPVPRVFGGKASLREAGLAELAPGGPVPTDPVAGYAMARSLVIAALVALIAGVGLRFGLLPVVAFAALVVVPMIASRTVEIPVGPSNVDRVQALPTGSRLGYRVTLAPEVRRRLLEGLSRGEQVTLFHLGAATPRMSVGDIPIPATQRLEQAHYLIDGPALRRALEGSTQATLAFDFEAVQSTSLGGWQRVGLRGREVVYSGTTKPSVVPHVEIRLLRDLERRTPVLIAY